MNNRKDESVNFRASALERNIIRRAAKTQKVSESEYARNSALKQAEMDLAEEINFLVSREEFDAFSMALERPVQVKPNLVKLLNEPSVLDS